MQVTTVTDPLNVMKPLEKARPDLILMDINMPGCNGIELAMVFRQQQEMEDIPIIFLSTESNFGKYFSMAMVLEIDDFLTKPISPDHLVLAVIKRVQHWRNQKKIKAQALQEREKREEAEIMIEKIQHETQSLRQLTKDGELATGTHLKGSEEENYIIKKKIGKGGMGVTYSAVRTSDSKKVAIKTLLPPIFRR